MCISATAQRPSPQRRQQCQHQKARVKYAHIICGTEKQCRHHVRRFCVGRASTSVLVCVFVCVCVYVYGWCTGWVVSVCAIFRLLFCAPCASHHVSSAKYDLSEMIFFFFEISCVYRIPEMILFEFPMPTSHETDATAIFSVSLSLSLQILYQLFGRVPRFCCLFMITVRARNVSALYNGYDGGECALSVVSSSIIMSSTLTYCTLYYKYIHRATVQYPNRHEDDDDSEIQCISFTNDSPSNSRRTHFVRPRRLLSAR